MAATGRERSDRVSVPTTDSKMYQTMQRQPADIQRLLADGWGQAEQAATLLAPARRIFVVGIGTSLHAAMIGAWLLRAAGSDARAVSSFDFALYPDSYPLTAEDAVVVMAHTGVKTYSAVSIQRAHDAGARVLSVGSLTAEHPGSELILRTVEREQSAAYTASHLAAMTVMAQVATVLGEGRSASGVNGFRAALDRLPDQIADVLARETEIQPVAEDALTAADLRHRGWTERSDRARAGHQGAGGGLRPDRCSARRAVPARPDGGLQRRRLAGRGRRTRQRL